MIKNLIFLLIIIPNLCFYLFFKEEVINEIKIIIKPGMQLDQIAHLLKENRLIKNESIFKTWVVINNSQKKLKFGEYYFSKKISANILLEKLKKGKSIYRKLTIIEGSTKSDLYNILNELDSQKSIEFDDIPNSLVADTYFYKVSDKPKFILNNIIKKSNEISKKIWNERDQKIPLNDVNELFILASIVEKETFIKEEKSIISGVFYNRFKKNMKLQSDPTVVYAITLGKKKMGRKLLRKDLKIKSKFNTYVNKGLPPEPICIPGIESLVATSRPFKSNFLYFVSKNKKNEGHLFSEKYKDHLENIKSVRKKVKNE